jgi:leader peptidase (prepilin peptidase)/N-methyltransferase
MTSLYILLFFIIGLLFGSFFNVVGLRLPQHIPFVNDRSRCPHCGHTLSWYENIPILSFFVQAGKCRRCRGCISFLYPGVELMTGFLFAYSFYMLGWQWELITSLLLVSMLMIILVSDLKYMIIPNKVMLFFLPFLIVMRIIVPLEPLWSSIIGALTGFVLLALIILFSRGGMGAGDMKLFALLGLVLGPGKLLLAFFLSCLLGGVIGMLLFAAKRVSRKQPVPFGPFIVIATVIAYFSGDSLLNWYFSIHASL